MCTVLTHIYRTYFYSLGDDGNKDRQKTIVLCAKHWLCTSVIHFGTFFAVFCKTTTYRYDHIQGYDGKRDCIMINFPQRLSEL